MKIAILADIHGNLEALIEVCADLDRRQVDHVVCLGDNVGYGPDPEAVTQLVRSRNYLGVLGNHEFALFDKRARRWLNFQAEENNQATRDLMAPESVLYCRQLPMHLCLEQAHFVHGYPPSSVFRYLNRQSDQKIDAMFAKLPARVFFVGHTHKLQLVGKEDDGIVRRPLREGIVRLDPAHKYIISAGSVGQPRDGDPRAKYMLWDSETGELQVLFVPYDSAVTKEKIRGLGFPDIYAARLG